MPSSAPHPATTTTSRATPSSTSHANAAHSRPKTSLFGPYRFIRTLGEGEFGKVKLAVHEQTGHEVAIKLIKKESVSSQSRMGKLAREIGILR
ncbi:hypothetical protein HK101_003709, partial [Irineochytrium annulatum]